MNCEEAQRPAWGAKIVSMGKGRDAGLGPVVDNQPHVEVTGALPMSLTTFVGRDRELNELRSLLREGKRLVTLTGIGGIGKTRLALELGFEAPELGWTNVYFVELGSVTNPGLIDSAVLESVGGGSSRSPLQATVDLLREGRALLVLVASMSWRRSDTWPRSCCAAVRRW
jgi:hypothetical protein